jgi:DNA-binding NtrC family response regulator
MRPREPSPSRDDDGLVGRSPALAALRRELAAFAAVDAPVLILGETGTGKELVAAALPRRSRRAAARFEPVNCGQLPGELLGAQLFGHERGAFTGAVESRAGLIRETAGGTLFLDEVGELVPAGQAALLRFLDSGEVRSVGGRRVASDVRLVAATNRDLLAAAWQGTFKLDLWYRLARLVLRVPPLRARLEDLPLLVDHALVHFNAAHGLAVDGVTPEALARLAAHPWPGNIRELRAVLERAMVLRRIGRLGAEALAFDPPPPSAPVAAGPPGGRWTPALRVGVEQRGAVALALARRHGQLTRRELVTAAGLAPNTALQTLGELVRAGQLIRRGRARGVHYVPVDRG